MPISLAIMIIPVALMAAVFFVLFYSSWQRQRIDIARRQLFTLRDEIFVLFAGSELTVAHPSHRELRRIFNRMIRYAHRITWFRVMLYIKYGRIVASPQLHNALDMIKESKIHDDVRRRVILSYNAIIRLMIFRSLPLLILRVTSTIMRHALAKWRDGRQKLEIAADTIFVTAEQEELAANTRRAAKAAT